MKLLKLSYSSPAIGLYTAIKKYMYWPVKANGAKMTGIV